MKKSKFSIAVVLIIVLPLTTFFVSCVKEEVDNEKPVINLIEPAADEVLMPGDAIHFNVEFFDNAALALYKVNIHGAFDGHTHHATAGTKSTRAESDSIAFEKTWMESDFLSLGEAPIAGSKNVIVEHQHMVIPEMISRTVNGTNVELPLKEGHYHFIVYCTDESGQESFVARDIFISYDADNHHH